MTTLQCNVNSCANNNCKGYCCRPSIHVVGETAHTSSDTSCRSFVERTQNQMTSGVQYDSANEALKVDCDAHRCVFNENKNCTASSISINHGYTGTECASFKQS